MTLMEETDDRTMFCPAPGCMLDKGHAGEHRSDLGDIDAAFRRDKQRRLDREQDEFERDHER